MLLLAKCIACTFLVQAILSIFILYNELNVNCKKIPSSKREFVYVRIYYCILLINRFSNPKERRVIECRKLGSYKQISKEVIISVRDIKPILRKYGVDDVYE
jgi:hypothetical protein